MRPLNWMLHDSAATSNGCFASRLDGTNPGDERACTVNSVAPVNWAPTAQLLMLVVAFALIPIGWTVARNRRYGIATIWRALVVLTLFLTFDLVVFGAYTRLSDSGLGCPDWPGCYGTATPLHAHDHIVAAQAVMPDGPVTPAKAWIEMIHRFLAATVGALILVLTLIAVCVPKAEAGRKGRWLCVAALVWVAIQGAFGALTVTLKLYPAIVSAHWLGGMVLLLLLMFLFTHAGQAKAPLPGRLWWAVLAVLCLLMVQLALGAWVSSNYAAIACADFPTCQGSWWPPMDFDEGFTLLRPLGQGAGGGAIGTSALTAIHVAHRLGALVIALAVAGLAWQLWRAPKGAWRQTALALVAVLLWQFGSGVSAAVLGWPLLAALGHSAGAAVLLLVLARTVARAEPTGS